MTAEETLEKHWRRWLTSANEQIEAQKKEFRILSEAFDALTSDKSKLNEQIERLKKDRWQDQVTITRLREENDKLRKERDEDMKAFYRWVIFDNDSLPTNSKDLDVLLSKYKQSLEK